MTTTAGIAGTAILVAAGLWPATNAWAADLLSGEWNGTYTCYQGKTVVTLDIKPDDENWVGVFAFGPPKDNKSVPRGAYDISISEDDGVYYVVPGEWIVQPDGYVAIGMRGAISADLMTFSGELDFDGCTTFETERLTLPPVVDGKVK